MDEEEQKKNEEKKEQNQDIEYVDEAPPQPSSTTVDSIKSDIKKSKLKNEDIITKLKNQIKILKRHKQIGTKPNISNIIFLLKEAIYELKNLEVPSKQNIVKGLVFKVQIGAYKKKDLSKIRRHGNIRENMLEQDNIENIHQYTLGTFRNFYSAQMFKKRIVDMFPDSFIVPFKNGKRVPYDKKISNILLHQKKEFKNLKFK